MAFNILIVDDSKVVRSIIEKTLRMAKVALGDVHMAGNGQEALALVEQHWVDVIFADINMPVMGGVEMIQKLSSNGVTRSIPVIVISTEGSATRIEDLKQMGVAAYLRKPISPEELSAIVHEVLGRPSHV
jgi:two-component system chemotaxis response regulator CheY